MHWPQSEWRVRDAALLRAALIANEERWAAEQERLLRVEAETERAREALRQQRLRARREPIISEPYTRQEVYDRDGGRCYMCDCRLGPVWHVEHVIPIARGGPDTLDNVRASCPRCNLRKGTQAPCYRT